MESAVKYLIIDNSQAGQRLLAFLGRNLRGQTGAPLPAALLHRLVRSGQVRVNRGRVKPDYRLQSGDVLRLPPLQRVSLAENLRCCGPEALDGQTSAAAAQGANVSGGPGGAASLKEASDGTDGIVHGGSRPSGAVAPGGCVSGGRVAAARVQAEDSSGREISGASAPAGRISGEETPHVAEGASAVSLGARLQARFPQIRIVAEDSACLVLNKPCGLAVHGGSRQERSLISLLLECAREMSGAGGFAPTLAHRLDRGTSGVLLVAKTYAFLRLIQDALQAGATRKLYLAWAAGAWPHAGRVELRDYLRKQADAAGREKMKVVTGAWSVISQGVSQNVSRSGLQAVTQTGPRNEEPAEGGGGGSLCLSAAWPLARLEGATLLGLELLTGRTHQLRVQLASRGHPIIGDCRYGGPPFDSAASADVGPGCISGAGGEAAPQGRGADRRGGWGGQSLESRGGRGLSGGGRQPSGGPDGDCGGGPALLLHSCLFALPEAGLCFYAPPDWPAPYAAGAAQAALWAEAFAGKMFDEPPVMR